MGAFLDRYHDAFHNGTNVDLINCPHCQDEFVQWFERDPEQEPVDRLEEVEV